MLGLGLSLPAIAARSNGARVSLPPPNPTGTPLGLLLGLTRQSPSATTTVGNATGLLLAITR